MTILQALKSKPHVLGAVADLGDGITQGRFAVSLHFDTAADAEAFRKAVIDEVSSGKVQTAEESAKKAGG